MLTSKDLYFQERLMTTITVSKDGAVCFPDDLLQLMGWQAGSELEVMSTDEGVILKSKDKAQPEADAALYCKELDGARGMIKANAPQGFNLMDFGVADHINTFT